MTSLRWSRNNDCSPRMWYQLLGMELERDRSPRVRRRLRAVLAPAIDGAVAEAQPSHPHPHAHLRLRHERELLHPRSAAEGVPVQEEVAPHPLLPYPARQVHAVAAAAEPRGADARPQPRPRAGEHVAERRLPLRPRLRRYAAQVARRRPRLAVAQHDARLQGELVAPPERRPESPILCTSSCTGSASEGGPVTPSCRVNDRVRPGRAASAVTEPYSHP